MEQNPKSTNISFDQQPQKYTFIVKLPSEKNLFIKLSLLNIFKLLITDFQSLVWEPSKSFPCQSKSTLLAYYLKTAYHMLKSFLIKN